MKTYKLMQLLQTLSEQEWDDFLAFLRSPYFTKEAVSWELCLAIRKFLTDSGGKLPAAEALFKIIWPDKTFQQKTLAYSLSRLNKLAERFLILQQQDLEPERQDLTALQIFSKRNLDKHFAATQRNFQARLSTSVSRGEAFYLLRSDYAELMDQHYVHQKIRKQDNSIQLATDDLDRYYYLRRLQYACSMLDRQNILEVSYKVGLSEAWMHHLTGTTLIGEPLIHLYLNIFRALREESEEGHFLELKTSLLNLMDESTPQTLSEPLLLTINYCARKIRAGQEEFVGEATELYRKGIEAGLLLKDKEISPWTYTNFVKLNLRLEQYSEAREFIEEYTDLLPASFRQNAHNFNYAELLYYTNEKERAQEYLNQVAYSDLGYYLGARVLLAKIYYETAAEESLLSLLASFTVFLQRNRQVSRNIMRTYLNFCQLFSRVLRTSPAKMDKVITRIEEIQPLTDRSWLLAVAKQISEAGGR